MDITLCEDNTCPLKETCLRFKGEVNKIHQSFFLESPLKNGKCEYYIKITKDTILTEKEEREAFLKVTNELIKKYKIE